MRKLGMLLAGLGGFLLVLAVLAKFYAPAQLMKTPIDVDSTTNASGMAALGSDSAAPVKGTSVTRADSSKSTSDVVVFVNSSCLIFDRNDAPDCVSADDPDERLITASVDNFAENRKTAVAINDPKYLPPGTAEHQGLINKWPFDAEKKTYSYWDDTAGQVVDAEYDGTESLLGVETYKYHAVITDAPIEVTTGVQGTYSNDKTIWVEPVTGSIVNQSYHMEQVTDAGDNFITLDLAFTDDEVKDSIADAKTNRDSLNLVRNTVPLIGLVLGVPFLLIGLLLTTRANRRRTTEPAETKERVTA